MGIRDRPITPRSPWQNAYVERVIGSIRRECLDHIIIWNEAHLGRVLNAGEGADESPPLSWSGVPANTKRIALIVDDPDAPDPTAPKMVWVHWLLYNIPPSTKGLQEGVKKLPAGTREGFNDWNRTGYGGPNPPIGRHRYFYKFYALDAILNLPTTTKKVDLEKAMRGHILAEAALVLSV